MYTAAELGVGICLTLLGACLLALSMVVQRYGAWSHTHHARGLSHLRATRDIKETQGQCTETPAYMAKECPATCGICTNVCEDKETDCPNWAQVLCLHPNPRYLNPITFDPNPMVAQNPTPTPNRDPNQEGQCEKNPGHMLTKCPQSCGVCTQLEAFYKVGIDGKKKDEL